MDVCANFIVVVVVGNNDDVVVVDNDVDKKLVADVLVDVGIAHMVVVYAYLLDPKIYWMMVIEVIVMINNVMT